MKGLHILLILMCAGFFASGQSFPNEGKSRNIQIFGFAGLGRATVHTNLSAPSKFPALELRIGAGISKSFNDYIELKSRLTLGNRLKTDSDPRAIHDARFQIVDENTSNRNHYFLEVPLVVQFNFFDSKFGVKAGGNYRQYLPSKPVDQISGQHEFGIITGVQYKITDKVSIGADYYFGLTKLFKSYGSIDEQEYNLLGRNRFAQITLELALKSY